MKRLSYLLLLLTVPAFLALGTGFGEEPPRPVQMDTVAIIPHQRHSYRVFHVEFVSPEARKKFKFPRATKFFEHDRFADLFVPLPNDPQAVREQIRETYKDEVVWVDYRNQMQAPPLGNPKLGTSKVASDPIVRAQTHGLTGKGVIIAVIDSGIDFWNPDFITYDDQRRPTSRLLYFWDTFSDAYADGKRGSKEKAPVSYPDGTPIGTVYTRDELTAELRASDPQIPVWDTSGHGTACAGIAAGNGQNGPDRSFKGVAPNADLIAVRIGGARRIMENAYLLNSICLWIQDKARQTGKPVVISCSFGGNYGGRDGNLVIERHLNKLFPLNAEGQAICISAGNEADTPMHTEVEVGARKKGTLRWKAQESGLIELYYEPETKGKWKAPEELFLKPGTRKSDVALILGKNGKIEPMELQFKFKGTLGERVKMGSFFHPLNRAPVTTIAIPPGEGEVELEWAKDPGRAIAIDAYIYPPDRNAFVPPSRRKQISTPGTTAHAITVGSYDWNNQFHWRGELRPFTDSQGRTIIIGGLSSYSSWGPSRSGVTKPEIVAPGQWYAAPAPRNVQIDHRDSSGKYRLFNGTSAATPYVAGVLALLLEKKPTLTLKEIKDLLQQHASHDSYTTEERPTPEWGYGKLDLKAVEAMIKALP